MERHATGAAKTIELGPLDEAIRLLPTYAGDKATENAVLLASGDPGFFGVVRALRAAAIPIAVLPALSSVQRIAAMVGRSWDDVAVVSAHG
ncbi:MAG TPA: SAM-dependent methyltransferase, partial [Pseudonocardiaceae bacterium]